MVVIKRRRGIPSRTDINIFSQLSPSSNPLLHSIVTNMMILMVYKATTTVRTRKGLDKDLHGGWGITKQEGCKYHNSGVVVLARDAERASSPDLALVCARWTMVGSSRLTADLVY